MTTRRLMLAATLLIGLLQAGPPSSAVAQNASWIDQAFDAGPASRTVGPVSARDLLALRDLDALALSPNGAWLAFSVRQPDVAADRYRVRWFVQDARSASAPIALAVDGGQPTPFPGNGYIAPEPAKWSPASDRFAFRRRQGEGIGLVVVDRATGAARVVADGAVDVTGFAWSSNGELLFRTGLDHKAFAAAVAREAEHGWLLDGRMSLWAAKTPAPAPPDCIATPLAKGCDVRTYEVLADFRAAAASADQVAALDEALRPTPRLEGRPLSGVGKVAIGPGGALAWTQTLPPWRADSSVPMRRIRSNSPRGDTCLAAACEGQFIKEIGWARQGRSLWFISGEGASGERQTIYEWRPGQRQARVVTTGVEVLKSCQAEGRTLYCIVERWTSPARIVAIDLDKGGRRVMADPNPRIAGRSFPKIVPLALRDREGGAGYAHLVYPMPYDPARKYPLVVVTYISNGFLRGGTGGEYPIFPLSAEGFFVLSITYPSDAKARRDLTSVDYQKQTRTGQRETRNVVHAIEQAVQPLIQAGLVDDKRVAITGLSFGAAIVHHAMQNSDMFAAGIASTGQGDLTNFAQFPEGVLRDKSMALYGETSPLARPGAGEIASLSWSQQPQRLRAPLLLNLHQNEALAGFEGVAVLKAEGRPVEVRIFPDEDHILFHPKSYAGVFDNNLMWLNYWLRDQKDHRPEFADQYVRWDRMRTSLRSPAD